MLARQPPPVSTAAVPAGDPRRAEPIDPRLTSGLRVVLVGAGLLIYVVDPTEPVAAVHQVARVVLILYLSHAVHAYVRLVRGATDSVRWLPWIDLAWTTILVAVSAGTSSIFFPLYLFAILGAAFEGGLRAGMTMVAASFLSYSIVGGLTTPAGTPLELDRALIRPLYMVVLGYLMSELGEHELRARARLAFLREAVALANPRFGEGHLVARLLGRLRELYGAEACRLVVREASGECWMRTAARGATRAGPAAALPAAIAEALLPEPTAAVFLYQGTRRWWPWRDASVMEIIEPGYRPDGRAETRPGAGVAAALDSRSFVSAPFPGAAGTDGRLYVASARRRAFDRRDAEFLVQVVEQIAPMLEKVRVVDKLATDAAEDERQRIARDLHDVVVQPYVGVSLGLAGVRQALLRGETAEASVMIDRLVEVANEEVESLRSYMRSLRDGEQLGGGVLVSAVRRFCSRFSAVTGIEVDVVTTGEPHVEPRIASEVFQIVAEALSNVRRHTEAASASVRIQARDDRVLVEIENEVAAPAGAERAFSPRSLCDRATALGGRVEVDAGAPDRTAVRVEIPL